MTQRWFFISLMVLLNLTISCARNTASSGTKRAALVKAADGQFYSATCLKSTDDPSKCTRAIKKSTATRGAAFFGQDPNEQYYIWYASQFPRNSFCEQFRNIFGSIEQCSSFFGLPPQDIQQPGLICDVAWFNDDLFGGWNNNSCGGQFDPSYEDYSLLSTLFTGSKKLTAVGDQLRMRQQDYTGAQHWRLEDVGNGWFKLKNLSLGDNICLDVINDGANDKVHTVQCANYSGQFLRKEQTPQRGYYFLKTMFTGNDKCLDIVNDGQNEIVHLSACGNYSGQYWNIESAQ